jgi:beta-glucosidase-like glycosyl hydrolase
VKLPYRIYSFKAAVDAGVRTFMNSFNELNGIPATGNRYLQREILKGDWNFDVLCQTGVLSMR